MLTELHRTSAFLFYILGTVAIVCAILLSVGMTSITPIVNSMDLPLIAVSLLYAGLSFYHSIARPGTKSFVLPAVIALPLLALFALFLVLNFVFPLASSVQP